MTLDGAVLSVILIAGWAIGTVIVGSIIWKIIDKTLDQIYEKPYTIDIFHEEPSTTYRDKD